MTNVAVHPGYMRDSFASLRDDIAVLTLQNAVDFADPNAESIAPALSAEPRDCRRGDRDRLGTDCRADARRPARRDRHASEGRASANTRLGVRKPVLRR